MSTKAGTAGKPPRHSQSRTTTTNNNDNNNIWRMAPTRFHDDSGDTSSEFFSPPPVTGSILPRSHDTSWIGARQSPIASFDEEEGGTIIVDDDGDDSEEVTERYHRALHQSLKQFDYGKNEKTHLLQSEHTEYSSIKRGAKPLHPLWDGTATVEEREAQKEAVKNYAKYYTKKNENACGGYKWAHCLMLISGMWLLFMTLNDLIVWFRFQEQYQAGTPPPWFILYEARKSSTIIQFGGMSTYHVIQQQQYWRIVASWFMCGSLPEWLALCACWSWIYSNPTTRPLFSTWLATYVGSAIVGQCWMMAWDVEAQAALAATWGTCGVFTAFGIDRPTQRDVCFVAAIILIVLAWWELPSNSVYGVTGASFFGWFLAATAAPTRVDTKYPRPSAQLRVVLWLMLVMTPVLSIAFRYPVARYNE